MAKSDMGEPFSVADARNVIAEAFKKDSGFRLSYVAFATAMMLDEGVDRKTADTVAEKIVKAFFETP